MVSSSRHRKSLAGIFRYDRAAAFTLVEILVVIAIIAVLMGILMVAMKNAKSMGKRLQCSVRLNGLGKAFSMYLTEYDPVLPTLEDYPYDAIQHYYTYRRQEYPGKTGFFWCGLGCLYGRGLIDNAMSFFCPATDGWLEDYRGGLDPATGKWGKPAGSFLKVRKGYVYWPLSKDSYSLAEWNELKRVQDQDAVNYLPYYPKSPTTGPQLDRGKAMISDYTFHEMKGSGWNLNALFPDGHVLFQSQPKDTDGVPMFHTGGQFGTSPGNVSKSVPITKFMNALQP